MRLDRIAALAALSLVLAASAALGQASAETRWQRHHPRRAEVNARLAHQNARIHRERAEGDINGAQAAAMHHEDRAIRREERRMASRNGGHITRAEQRRINRQENAVSRQIGH